MAIGDESQGLEQSIRLGRQVSAMISDQQGRLLDQMADERQLSVSAIVREAIRAYLAAVPNAVAAAR